MLSLTVEKKSWLHNLPGWLKLLILSIVSVLMLPVSNPWISVLACLCVGLLHLSAGMAFARIGLSRLKPLKWLLAILFAYLVIIGEVEQAFAICFKLLAMVALANLVTMTTRLDDMMAIIETLTKPLYAFGLPPRAFGIAMGLVVRFTPVFLQKGTLLNEAWRARSAKRSGPRLIVPLALGALDDADRVADALRARGGLAGVASERSTTKEHVNSP